MDELSRFKATYIEECYELLEDMEERLVNFEDYKDDPDNLNAIFRCAHSIKGGAGTFGLNYIAKFTHILEALLDNMRDGKLSPTKEIIDKLLQAKDMLVEMVKCTESNTNYDEQNSSELVATLQKIASSSGMVINVSASEQSGGKAEEVSDEVSVYSILFRPHSDLFLTGNEPLLLIKELAKLGVLDVKPDFSKVPKFSELINPEDSYMNFDFTLETQKPESQIREVFEFVEDSCELTIELVASFAKNTPTKNEAIAPNSSNATTSSVEQNANSQADKDSGAKEPQKQNGALPSSIRVDVDKIDKLVNLVGEIVITQAMIQAQVKKLSADQNTSLVHGVEEFAHRTRDLQEAVMSVRMQPVKSIFSRMPRLVRDVAQKLGKEIQLDMSGESTEVDKTIIEQLADPLTHIIRNSLDHGIEKPQDRLLKGKTNFGTIKLKADQRGGKIVIEISDDGAGINREKVLVKAKEKGLIPQDSALSTQEIDELIFLPGFSTASEVTDISGRGVGMDVVRRNIESIGGAVQIQNNPGVGMTLLIFIPLTLAILDGMIVKVGDEKYIIPISNILETLRPKPENVKKIAEGNDLINIRGNFLPVYYLHKLFEINGAIQDPSSALVVIVESSNTVYGLVVDELISQQQVVIKSLNHVSIDCISGATILGDGKVSLILDMGKIHTQAYEVGNKVA